VRRTGSVAAVVVVARGIMSLAACADTSGLADGSRDASFPDGEAPTDANADADAARVPFVLANGQTTPQNIAAGPSGVYWVSGSSIEASDGGGPAVTAVVDAGMVRGLALDRSSATVLWTDPMGLYALTAGSTRTIFTNTNFGQVAAAGGVAYVIDPNIVTHCPENGTSCSSITPVTPPYTNIRALAANDLEIFYCADADGGPRLYECKSTGCGPSAPLVPGLVDPHGTVSTDYTVYWFDPTELRIYLLELGNAQPSWIDAQGRPVALAVDDGSIFWATEQGGIWSAPGVSDSGASPVQLASRQPTPTSIAAYGGRVYWTNAGDATVMGLATR
jgi:hypothetical protein